MYYYSWNQWITFFFIYSFLGWVWESCYVSIKSHRWVNRGFLRMPMLPLYGSGATIMLLLTLPFPGNYVLQYCLGVIGPTILEYFTGWAMEKLFKMRYWDYSNQRFNIKGYICLTSSIAWGFFTLLMTYVLHPPIEHFVLNKIPPVVDYVVIAVVGVLFVLDTIESAKVAVDVGKALEKMTDIRAQIDDIQVQLSLLKSQAARIASEKKEAAIDKVYAAKNNAKITAQDAKEEAAQKMAALAAKLEELNLNRESITKGMSIFHRGLLRGNPTAASDRFGAALKELKERFR
ncbi:MAG: putative ABC transporter permease [[Bacteroides] pectinophilus]|nr:putative ABC transporter permease [[Bacteroides] pectinophilus]